MLTVSQTPFFTTQNIVRYALFCLLGSILITLSAKIQIPFYPVPMTMQLWAIITIALLAKPSLSSGIIGLYLLEGALGLPVFSGTPERGFGLPYMLGPTGGYLLGFLMATILLGYLQKTKKLEHFFWLIPAVFATYALIIISGIMWLTIMLNMPLNKALAVGFFPFVYGDILKLVLAIFAARMGQKFLRETPHAEQAP